MSKRMAAIERAWLRPVGWWDCLPEHYSRAQVLGHGSSMAMYATWRSSHNPRRLRPPRLHSGCAGSV